MKREDRIEYEAAPITPLPWVYESASEATWRLWDAAVRMQDVIASHDLGALT